MAQSQIAGLFMTPEMYRQQQMQADRMRAMEYAQMAPEQRAAMGFFSAGQGLGRAAGTLLGAQDPQLQRITEQQQLLQGLDVADPESLMEAARRASQAGNTQLAMQLAGRAQEVAQGIATTQKAQLSLAQEQQLRAELASLPADATDEQRIAILSKHGPPGQMFQALMAQVGRREGIESREAEAERNREARRQDLELQLKNRLDFAAAQGATQQQIAQMQVDGRQQIAEMMAGVQREIAAGRQSGQGRATPTESRQEAKMTAGREQLNSEIESILKEYEKLNELGAMTRPSRGTVENISARARASSVGQYVAGYAGTQEQTIRDNIRNARARLTNAVKEATGMSAQQMNSNVELQLWLSAMTDPTQSYETVTKTLGDLNTIIGKNMRQPGETPGASGSWADGTTPAATPATAPAAGGRPATDTRRRIRFDAQGNVIQ
jgi:hypothetical protein